MTVVAIGWLLDRRLALQRETLVKLGLYLFVPCFIFVRLVDVDIPRSTALLVPVFTLCSVVGMGLLGLAVALLRGFSSARTRAFTLAAMFYNAGNYGLPLVILALGDLGGHAGEIQIFVIVTINVLTFTLGICIASANPATINHGTFDSLRHRVAAVARMPSLYMIALAWLVHYHEIPVQGFTSIWFPLSVIADGLIPVALLTLGVQLSQARWCRKMLEAAVWVVLIRLVAGPIVGYLLIMAFNFEGVTAATLLIGCAVPSAVNVSLIAEEFDADPEFAASAVMVTTVLSVIPVTLTIYVARLIFLS